MVNNNEEAITNLNRFVSELGLEINNYIAKKLDHKIEFKPVYGKGSEFSIELNYSDFYSRNLIFIDKKQ
jgi:hypothetical protein